MRKFLIYSVSFWAIGLLAEAPPSKPPSIYSPAGKRDPFRLPSIAGQTRGVASLTPLERFNIEQLQLRAILKIGGKSRAMFEDPDGKTHIVFEGNLIGRERATISRILNSEVIVTQKTFNYLGQENLFEKVISLPALESISGTNGPAGPIEKVISGIKKAQDRTREIDALISELGNTSVK